MHTSVVRSVTTYYQNCFTDSIYQSIHLSVSIYQHPSVNSIYLPTCISLSLCEPTQLSNLPICIPIYLDIYLFIYLPTCVFIYLFVNKTASECYGEHFMENHRLQLLSKQVCLPHV